MYAGRKVEEAPVERDLRPPAASLYAGAARLGAEARFVAGRWRAHASWRRSPAWCRACGRRSSAARSPAAARWRPSCARAWRRRSRTKAPGHLVACHYAESRTGKASIPPRHRRRRRMTAERLLEVNGLKKHFPIHGGVLRLETAQGLRGGWRVVRTSTAARRCRWWANRAAASRPSARRSCGCIRSPPARCMLAGERIDNLPAGAAAADAPARAGGVPGPVLLAQSAHAGARHPGRADLINFGIVHGSRETDRARRAS